MIILNLQRWKRFLLAGGLNTAATYCIYLVLSILLHYQIAYFFAYIAGIVFAYYLNSRFVFDSPMSIKKFLTYPLVYIISYLLSVCMLQLLVLFLLIKAELAPLIVIMLMVPVTYFLNKLVLLRKPEDQTKV